MSNAGNDSKKDYTCYVNREISWLKFNERVLEEAEDSDVPLLERLNFISIFQSNLDEFFMVRVGALHDAMLVSNSSRDNKSGMTPKEQLDAVMVRVKKLLKRKDAAYAEIMSEVEQNGIRFASFSQLSDVEQDFVRLKFEADIKPLLFPAVLGKKQPFPFLKNNEVYGFAVLETKSGKRKIAIVPSLSPMLPRIVKIPEMNGSGMVSCMSVDELILHFFEDIFVGYRIVEKSLVKIVRNADIDEARVYDEDLDYREHMEEVIKMRKKLCPVRLDLSRKISDEVLNELCGYLQLDKKCVFLSNAPLSTDYVKAIRSELSDDSSLSYKPRTPQKTISLTDAPIIPQVLKKDVLLHYPYESISPFFRLLQEASNDKNVISIQMTLYRLASHSKVIEALIDAAENGKEVNVLVELKARFDEENNINWSKSLERAGCRVVYGIDGLKVHSKICLITRRDGDNIQYITQIGTGNYNESTARLYTDLSLITSNKEIGIETGEVFRKLLMGETVTQTNNLLVAPNCLQNNILDKIDIEIDKAKSGKPAYIGLKLNSLTDIRIIKKLIEASQAGVRIEMVVRGICCLKPGIKGYTDNIRVISIVGRLLEHSRIYIFGASPDNEIYISSADFMTRNTLKRVEVAAPILDKSLKQRIEKIFITLMSDNTNARIMQSDGSYKREKNSDAPYSAQEVLYDIAYQNASNR
ncbi:MAG: polyphosphate kinase 1 [Ruminococcus sp.]|nr:polyphosphate kinase 1 [Ruminococcus sp.]